MKLPSCLPSLPKKSKAMNQERNFLLPQSLNLSSNNHHLPPLSLSPNHPLSLSFCPLNTHLQNSPPTTPLNSPLNSLSNSTNQNPQESQSTLPQSTQPDRNLYFLVIPIKLPPPPLRGIDNNPPLNDVCFHQLPNFYERTSTTRP